MKGMWMERTDRRLEFRVQDQKFEVRGSRFEVQRYSKFKVRSSKSTHHATRNTQHGSSPQSPVPSPKGFTLLEVLVALAVLAVALVGLLGLHNRNLLLMIRAERLSTATLLAREVLTRTQLEGQNAAKVTNGDFSAFHPGQYSEFRWRRTVRPAPVEGLWELRVNVLWGEREDERCELTLFTPLS